MCHACGSVLHLPPPLPITLARVLRRWLMRLLDLVERIQQALARRQRVIA